MSERNSVEALARTLREHVTECSDVRRENTRAMQTLADAVKGVQTEISAFKALPMKAVRWLGGIVVAAAVTLLVQNFMLHQESTAKAQQAALEATQAAGNTDKVLGVVRDIKAAQTGAAGS